MIARLQPHLAFPRLFSASAYPLFPHVRYLRVLMPFLGSSALRLRLHHSYTIVVEPGSIDLLTHDRGPLKLTRILSSSTEFCGDPASCQISTAMQLDLFPHWGFGRENIVIKWGTPQQFLQSCQICPFNISLINGSRHACSYSSPGFGPFLQPRLLST